MGAGSTPRRCRLAGSFEPGTAHLHLEPEGRYTREACAARSITGDDRGVGASWTSAYRPDVSLGVGLRSAAREEETPPDRRLQGATNRYRRDRAGGGRPDSH
jgi:hypothetical protein